MKTILASLITSTLLGFVSLANSRPFDIADFAAVLFASGLVAWTIEQYSSTPRPLARSRIIRLPATASVKPVARSAQRLAA